MDISFAGFAGIKYEVFGVAFTGDRDGMHQNIRVSSICELQMCVNTEHITGLCSCMLFIKAK